MHLSRHPILPTVDDLVRRAIATTRYVAEVTGDEPLDIATCSELAAQLAAENWEREVSAAVGATVPHDLVTAAGSAIAAATTPTGWAGRWLPWPRSANRSTGR